MSREETTAFRFDLGATELDTTIARKAFEGWIAEDLDRIAGAVDLALARAGLDAGDIDRVFLTGGSSFVPAVRALFAARFGPGRIESGDELVSIAHGLAMIGGREDIDLWCVDEAAGDREEGGEAAGAPPA